MTAPDRPETHPACIEVAELLPFYLNRSLEPEEIRRVKAHLLTCPACRRDAREAGTAEALFEGHLPVELLVDHALGLPLPAASSALVESHLAACERCSGEVALVGQEPEGASVEPHPTPRWDHRRTRAMAVAAGLAAVVALAGWLTTWQRLAQERALSSTPRARANPPVVELLPAREPLRRGGSDGDGQVNPLPIPDGEGELVLVLLAGGENCRSGCILELGGAGEGEPARRVEGLEPSPNGHLTVALPTSWLTTDPPWLTIREESSGEIVAEYRIRAQRAGQ